MLSFENFIQKNISSIKKWDKMVFCDIDWTIYRNSLFLDILTYLIKEYENQNIKNNEKINKLILKYFENKNKWKTRKINYEEFLEISINLFLEFLNIINFDKLKNIIEKISKNIKPLFFKFTNEKLLEYKKQWYKIIFISWSLDLIVKNFVDKFNFDIWIWSYLEEWEDNNKSIKYTHIMATNENKIKAIKYIIKEKEPSDIISFGDTNWDYEMLTIANKWYAINPTNELYEKIREKNNIDVILERKDLILNLDYNSRKNIKNISFKY